MRIAKIALVSACLLVFGAGQTPGETIGNGRATAILLAREGARVLVVDRDAASGGRAVASWSTKRGCIRCLRNHRSSSALRSRSQRRS